MGIAGPKTTRRYSERFKASAVRLSSLPGVRVQDVAESLYIHPSMLSLWRRPAREGVIGYKRIEVDRKSWDKSMKNHMYHRRDLCSDRQLRRAIIDCARRCARPLNAH